MPLAPSSAPRAAVPPRPAACVRAPSGTDQGQGTPGGNWMSRAPERRMFYTIDGLRGIAALLGVCRHIVPLHANKLNFPSSYPAVKLFFLFSGFVIAHASDKRFDAGMKFGEFFKARLLRL